MRLALVTLAVVLLAAEGAHAFDCGSAQVPPAGSRVGAAPLAVGDSVMLGAARKMGRAGFDVDARCARNPADGIDLLRSRERKGRLPEIVLMALGTNRPIASRHIEEALRVLGPRRTLMLVTPTRSGRPFQTGPMRRAARREPDRVKLIDWSSRAMRNRRWLAGDGTHLTPSGARAYTRILKRGAWSRQRGRFGR